MSITWRGRGIRDMIAYVDDVPRKMARGAEEDLDASVDYGGARMQDALEAATTSTGERRAERGGFPGRHDTGNFIASIGSNSGHLDHQGDEVWGAYGVFAGDFEQYMRDQDEGAGNIPAARSLPISFGMAREFYRARLKKRFGG